MKCSYMTGAGNDFMVVDARGQDLDYSALARDLCHLRGADGFMAVEASQTADFRLRFFNADGSEAEMCGNGSRCICKFAYDQGIAGEAMTVETLSGLVRGLRISENRYRVALGLPTNTDLTRLPDCAYTEIGCPGVPHAVMAVPGLGAMDPAALRDRAEALRWDPAFPKGANVNFFDMTAPGKITILTYERGVEDFTLACGTGAGACAVILWRRGLLPQGRLTAVSRGGALEIGIQGQGETVRELTLEGPAETLEVLDV